MPPYIDVILGKKAAESASSTTVNGAFTINPTASSAFALTVNLGGDITVTGLTTITAHPEAADIANLSESTQMRNKWRINAVHADADSITYSVKAWPIP